MIPDLDIYRSANLLVKRHGQDAPIEAAMRADDDRVRHAHFQHSTRTVNSRAWAATSRAASCGFDGAVS